MGAPIAFISSIFSNKLWRNIIFAVGILLVVLILWIWLSIAFSKKRHQPVITLLQSVEYIEQLKLVDFYYEEVIFLGDSTRAEKDARELEHEKAAAYATYLKEMQVLDSLKGVYGNLEAKLIEEESKVDSIGRLYEKVQEYFNELPRIDIRRINKLEENPNRYTPDIRTAYVNWTLIRNIKIKEKKAARKILDHLLDEEFETRKKNKDSFQDFFKVAEKEFKEFRRDHQKQMNEVEKAVKKQERAFNNAKKDYNRTTEKAEAAALKAKESRNKTAPELLIIAPAQVSGFIDMAKLKMQILGDTLLRIELPEPELDSVFIEIDSSRYFDINGLAKASNDQGGKYFAVYLQLKSALMEAREDVKFKALENGILTETEKMAVEYFDELGKSFGYQVEIITATARKEAEEAAKQAIPENTPPAEATPEDTNIKG